MAEKNGSAKARASVDTQKKTKEEIKLPSLSPAQSPIKKSQTKDAPPSKPTPMPSASVKAVKAPPPKSPSKPSARSTPTKLSPAVKAQSTQLVAFERHVSKQANTSEADGFKLQERGKAPVADGSQLPTSNGTENQAALSEAEVIATDVELSIDAATAAAAAEAEAIAAAEEAERLRKLNGNGMAKLVYEQYDELFPIVDGSTTQENVDEVYCLSFVMPNCLVRLSQHPNPEQFRREESGIFDSLVREDPRGTYHDLEKDQTYYVVVEQEADQLRRDQEATKARWGEDLQKQQKENDDGRGFETCSCIYGNPCVDEYGCRDWHSRFAIATKNGWKGF